MVISAKVARDEKLEDGCRFVINNGENGGIPNYFTYVLIWLTYRTGDFLFAYSYSRL